MNQLQIGISLPVRGAIATADTFRTIAQRAEALGFHSLLVSDHLVIPKRDTDNYPYDAHGRFDWQGATDFYEPLGLLTWLAGQTQRLVLGTSVLILPYRNPVELAKRLSTLDRLSGGRLVLGVGTGWWAAEFEALGLGSHFAERGPRTDEYIRVLRNLWTASEASYQGRFVRYDALEFSPKPQQPGGIPIWVGGHTKRALRRVAELGDVWHPIVMRPPASLTPPELQAAREDLARLCDKTGRDGMSIPTAIRSTVTFGPRDTLFSGTPEEIAADLRAYAGAGVSHVTLNIEAGTLPAFLEQLERIAADVFTALT